MMSIRADHFTVEQVERVVTFGSDDAMQKKWKAFYRKINTKTDNFGTVLKTIVVFLTKPFTATVVGKAFTGDWTAQNDEWV